MEKTQVKTTASLQQRLSDLNALFTELKAENVVSIDVSQQSGGGFADRLLVLTATSPRHARSIADAVSRLCHDKDYDYLRVEGYQLGEWVLVDLNDIIVSIFLESTRALYRLEDLWTKLPRKEY